ncbi:hypothetical protein [Clostridium sp. CF012]|uniref:hypothetical protein n=1 Tax=Clostridium sp. CF012 TaxID=2843319 RepID=UPI001C0AA96E|nr:hypothetical protein [Clostridium sp. CF012]MBU3146834.1 hypothetical protein [Clostridium sp. CF012]
MNRKTELYKIALRQNRDGRVYEGEIILLKMLEAFFSENKFIEGSDKIFECKSKDLRYMIDLNECNGNIRKVRFVYLKYNKKVTISDLSFKATKTKNKNEGDEERQHIVIKGFGDNKALIVWEKISGSVTKANMEREINRYYVNWIKQFDEDKKKELNKSRVRLDYIPSMEFVEELMKMDKISLLKVTIDKENLKFKDDEDMAFNEDHISKPEIDLIYTPKKSRSFSNAKIRKYFEKYMSGVGTDKIKRIIIQGKKDDNTIRLDTEGMKLSKFIQTELDIDGLVNSESLFGKYVTLIETYGDELGELLLDIVDNEE